MTKRDASRWTKSKNQMSKRLGQHFLVTTSALKKIAAALEVKPGDTIIEIGPGHGELTNELLAVSFELLEKSKLATKVIAIEKDAKLARRLKERFSEKAVVDVIEGDVLIVLPDVVKNYKLKATSYKLTGNIPYYVTGYLLRTIGDLEPKPERCVFTVQKEVAERLTAVPPRMNRLAASVQFWAEPRILTVLPGSGFRPRPKVDSAVVVLKTRGFKPGTNPQAYYKAVRVLFQQPRKTLSNNLTEAGLSRKDANEVLKRNGLDPDLRPQNLDIQDILRIGDDFRMV